MNIGVVVYNWVFMFSYCVFWFGNMNVVLFIVWVWFVIMLVLGMLVVRFVSFFIS